MIDSAQKAAEIAVRELGKAIESYGGAVWVLAGGTSPAAAYEVIAKDYKDKLDWSKVVVLMGDERCVPVTSPDSNWGMVDKLLLNKLPIPSKNQIRLQTELSPDKVASDFEKRLKELPVNDAGLPRLDHVWLGIGEDGHTLSMFPGQEAVWQVDDLAVAVYDSPKPPPQRVSLSLEALAGTVSCLVFAVGESKAPIVERFNQNDTSLPITRAVQAIESAGGAVEWLVA